MKAVPRRLCLNTLPCCSGTAGKTSLSFCSGADPLVWREGSTVLFPPQEGWDPRGQAEGWAGQRGLRWYSYPSKAVCSGQTLLLLTLGGSLSPPGPHTLDFA